MDLNFPNEIKQLNQWLINGRVKFELKAVSGLVTYLYTIGLLIYPQKYPLQIGTALFLWQVSHWFDQCDFQGLATKSCSRLNITILIHIGGKQPPAF